MNTSTAASPTVVGNDMKHIILIILTVITTAVSYACECRITEFSKEVNYADQIFIGKVLNKNITGINAHYLFSVSKIFKGNKVDTLSITTGLGGPDCGMIFQVGETYLVYSQDNQTTRCRRNGLADGNADIVKLKYVFNTYFSNDIGKSDSPVLTDNEAEYFNAEFSKQRKDYDFHGKKVAFVLGSSFIDKEQYFKNYGGKEVVANLTILTEEEKQKANGYNAIIVLWRKQSVGKSFRKKIFKRLT
jgi:hypothetical protein